MKHRNPSLPCEERERLRKAYEDALQKKYSLEDQITQEIVSRNRSKGNLAKKQVAKALKHAVNILDELNVHEKSTAVPRLPIRD